MGARKIFITRNSFFVRIADLPAYSPSVIQQMLILQRHFVIPAKAGIHGALNSLESRFRGNDMRIGSQAAFRSSGVKVSLWD
jgi:hypothetical protein